MYTLDREALAKYAKRRYRTEPVDWIAPGMTMVIQSLTERERAEIERKIGDPECKASTRALLLIAAIVDDNHNRIFDESHAEWLDSLDSQIGRAHV